VLSQQIPIAAKLIQECPYPSSIRTSFGGKKSRRRRKKMEEKGFAEVLPSFDNHNF
jgi:hypothetical protein